ncbi:MAG TPA: TonB-dependent receptor [Candidatus Sulfotelmatobacter sp.]|nr:TonB-dependent receptor [Candidatus Sulfotelmatobacter sp.]
MLLSLLLTITLFTAVAAAQEATIVGTVMDTQGAAIPNATLVITNTDTGIARTVTTAADGQYVVPDLHIGHYLVRAQVTGFKIAERKDLVLQVGDRTRIDFSLQVGDTKETITVEGNAIAVQTESGEVSNVVTSQQVSDLPTNGRTLYNLYALTPGAVSLQGDNISPTAVSGDNNVSINGQRMGHNLMLIDGGENLDRGGSQASVAPSLESIGEFRMNTSNYSAEYGMSGASTITQVVKSGTRRYHADAWWFGRNDALDARNYFNPAPAKVAELRYNLYGFNGGGPVDFWKSEHKTFFFYNMEWRSLIQGQLLNQLVPFAGTYGGNFSSNLPSDVKDVNGVTIPHSGLHAPCQGQLSPALQTAWQNAGQTLSTPDANGGCSPNTGLPLSQNPVFQALNANAIPAALLDPNAQLLLNAGGKYGGIFPAPTTSDGHFIGGNNVPTKVREEIVRVDHQFNSKFSIFGHLVSEQISQNYGNTMWSGDNVPSIGNTFGNPAYSAVVHLTHIINPTLLNEVAFNYDGNRIHILPQGLVSAPSGFQFNRLFSGPNASSRIPSINLNGSTGANYTANWTPWNNAANDYQIRDDVSWTKGAHQFKFGFSWMLYKKVQSWFANTQGNFNFNGSFTGNDFADYLLGYSQQYTENAVQDTGHWNNVSYGLYAQDNWRATHRLTLNLGLRWDGMPHTYEVNHQSANFYPNLYNPANAATFWNDGSGNICSAAASATANFGCTGASPGLGTSPNPILAGLQFYTNGIGIGGVNGIPKGLVNNPWANFGPRVGFAYDLTGQGKTVIRGGFGIMFDRIQGNDMYNGATNPPMNASPTLNNVSLSNPGFSVKNGDTITAATLPILPLGVTGIQSQGYKLPTTYQYSVGVQQAMGKKTVLSLSYVGSQNRNMNYYQEINLPAYSALPALIASGGTGINELYNYKGFGAIRMAENGQEGHYNAFQADLHGQVRHDLYLQFAYTVSRAIDPNAGGNGSGGDLNNITNPYAGWRYDVGPSSYDRTNVAFVNFVYDLPIFRNTENRLLKTTLGGWQLSGIVNMMSGAPLNLGVTGSNVASVIQNSGNRPNLNGSITYPKTVGSWFNPAVFSVPTGVGTDIYGNAPFNAIRGPGRQNWNLSLFKSFLINEARGSRFELRADAFNTWNHTQFRGDANTGGISRNAGAGDFGAVTAAFDPREFQLGARLVF